MLEYLTAYEFVVALAMSMAAVCAFVWAAVSGQLRDVEQVKYRVLEMEEEVPP